MSTLIVVAHPDDEVLGAGGYAHVLPAHEHVHVVMLCGQVTARTRRPDDDDLVADLTAATAHVGIGEPILGPFPNIRMNTVDHLDLVQFIEDAIRRTRPTRLITHHPSDLNDDHRQVSHAAQAAARLHQRGADVPRLASLLFMEVLSSTGWAFPGAHPGFTPTGYVELGDDALTRKVEACAMYRHVMRDYPHPRSEETVRALATFRGAQAGMRYAEAFQVAFVDVGPGPAGPR